MAASQSIVNQFFGINPMLHSQLQAAGGWDHFQVNHISDLTRFLQRDLRTMGYVAQSEQSLQIRRRETASRAPESDVTVYDPARQPATTPGTPDALALSVPQLLDLDERDLATYRAVGIYRKAESTETDARGEAVAWLELLSPTNKPGGRHFAAYREKRVALLQAGLVFIELDYLHHQPPTIAVPPYPEQPESSPWRIVVIDPRPDWLHGQGRVYPARVDEPLPVVRIPLNAGDVLNFSFDAPYQQTFEALFFGDGIDYSVLPPDWSRYRADDRARILSRLLAIRDNEGLTETTPEPVSVLSLEAALARWHAD